MIGETERESDGEGVVVVLQSREDKKEEEESYSIGLIMFAV
jgi:hypothetical protein